MFFVRAVVVPVVVVVHTVAVIVVVAVVAHVTTVVVVVVFRFLELQFLEQCFFFGFGGAVKTTFL